MLQCYWCHVQFHPQVHPQPLSSDHQGQFSQLTAVGVTVLLIPYFLTFIPRFIPSLCRLIIRASLVSWQLFLMPCSVSSPVLLTRMIEFFSFHANYVGFIFLYFSATEAWEDWKGENQDTNHHREGNQCATQLLAYGKIKRQWFDVVCWVIWQRGWGDYRDYACLDCLCMKHTSTCF